MRRGSAVALVSALLFAGCSSGPVPPVASPVDSLPTAELLHTITGTAGLPRGGWAVWLWRNVIPDSALEFTVSARVVLQVPTSASEPFVAGYYPIQAALSENGTVLYMSEVAAPRLKWVDPRAHDDSQTFAGYEFGASAKSVGVQGFLVFAEAPSTFHVEHTHKDSSAAAAPSTTFAPLAAGVGLQVTYPDPPSPTMAESGASAELAVEAPGFVTAAVLREINTVGAPQGAEIRVSYPDGRERIRQATGSIGTGSAETCPTPENPCRSVWNHPNLDDLGVGCQPAGSARATVTADASPNVPLFPVVVALPFDYCTLFGATSETPHPCADMTRPPFSGCP